MPLPTAIMEPVAVKVVVLPLEGLKVPRDGVSMDHWGETLTLPDVALLQAAVNTFAVPVLTTTG